jgi:hypothetical protein
MSCLPRLEIGTNRSTERKTEMSATADPTYQMSTGLLNRGFPAPPAGREGWPWTVETPPPDESQAWPKITVITPSYMQGEFLEQTIRSVLLQNYPNLEYFVLDGGSTDSSREVIEKYRPWLAGWRCEKDAGQAATINEGWARASGDVLAWINSDDWYQPGAFTAIAPLFHGPQPAAWAGGAVDDCGLDGAALRRHPARATPLEEAIAFHETGYYQPGMFWSRQLIEKVGPLDGSSHLCFDLEFWARSLVAGFTFVAVDAPIACFRQHPASKTSSQLEAIVAESRAVFDRYAPHLAPPERRQSAAWLQTYAADLMLHTIYRCLREGQRVQARGILFRELGTVLALRPLKLALGVIFHVLISGRPPAWFTEEW